MWIALWMFKLIYPRIFAVWQRLKYFCVVWNMLNMENYRQLSAKFHLISKGLASCLLTTWLFSTALSVALGFQISLLVACFFDIGRLSKYSMNTTISFLQNSHLFFWKKLAIPLPTEKNPGCSTGFESLISHWITWRSVLTYVCTVGRTEVRS